MASSLSPSSQAGLLRAQVGKPQWARETHTPSIAKSCQVSVSRSSVPRTPMEYVIASTPPQDKNSDQWDAHFALGAGLTLLNEGEVCKWLTGGPY